MHCFHFHPDKSDRATLLDAEILVETSSNELHATMIYLPFIIHISYNYYYTIHLTTLPRHIINTTSKLTP